MLTLSDLHDYQTKAVERIKLDRRCLLAIEMGLGKTVTTLTAVSDMLDSFEVRRVLVVAPLRVAKSVWAQEVRQWAHLKHLSVGVIIGSQRERLTVLQNRHHDIYTINRENLPWLIETLGDGFNFDAVVIDESQSFKNPGSKRFKMLKRVLPKIDVMVLLSGTPSPNSLLDIWSQIYMIDYGMRLGRTMTAYKKRFFEQSGYMGYTLKLRDGAADKIHELISDVALSMTAEDYLDLPERIDLTVQVDLPPKVADQYREFESKLLLELDGGEVEAATAAVLANKLLQFCNGSIYTDEMKNYQVLHDAKLDALEQIIEDNPNENILLAYSYKADLERLKARFPQAVELDKSTETITRWNDGEIPLLLAHPASAGHGLNLQHGGSMAVWFGLTWSLEYYQQFNARLHRQGQQCAVRIVHIIAGGCLDERVMSVLAMKDAGQQDLIDALKAT